MASVSGSLGGQPVVLDNMATEATLKAILSALQGQTSALGKMASASKGGGGAGGAAMDQMAKSALGAVKALNPIVGVGMSVVSGLASIAGGAMEVAGSFAALTKAAFDGNIKLSSFFGAFKNVPIIGSVMGLFEGLMKIQEEELDVYRDLTKTGINYGGNLRSLRNDSVALGMGIKDFAQSLKENKDVFTGLGGTVDQGARQFTKFATALRDSKAGETMRALGMTQGEMNAALGTYMRDMGGLTEKQKKDYQGVAASAAEYAKQTDLLTKLTGQSKEELEKKMKQDQLNNAYENKLQSMDAATREKYQAAMKAAAASGIPGAVEALKSEMLGLPPMTDAAQEFTALMGGEGQKAIKSWDKVAKSSGSVADAQKEANKTMGHLQVDAMNKVKELGEDTVNVMSVSGNQFANGLLQNSTKMQQMGVKDYASQEKRIAEAEKQQQEQAKSVAAATAEAEKNLQDLGKIFNAFLNPLLNVLSPIMNQMINTFTNFVNGPNGRAMFEKFGAYLGKLVQSFADYIKNFFTDEGRDKIVNDLKYWFKVLMIELKQAILPKWLYSEEDAKQDREALDRDKKLYDERAKASVEMAAKETELKAAELKTKKGALEEHKALESKTAKELNDLRAKEADAKDEDLQKIREEIQKKQATLNQLQAVSEAEKNMKKEDAEAMIKDRDAKLKLMEENKKKLKIEEKKPEHAKAPEHPAYASIQWGGEPQFANGTAGLGAVMQDFGKGTSATLHGKEAVLNEQQMKNLISNTGGGGGSQDQLISLLTTLNMQTGRLVAINAEAADYQKKLLSKFDWSGNLFH